MTISETAKAHHDQMFGERVSTLAQTDPEFIAYFDDFAFGEILADAADLDDGVDLHTRLLVQLAAVLAAGGSAEFRALATAALANAGFTPVELKELVYHAVPYVGLARAYEYLHAVNDILIAAGVQLPLAGQATSTSETRHERGKQVQERIVGAGRVDRMHADAPQDCKHFQRYLTGNCFGDTVARDGLNLATRELLTFAMLAAMGGADTNSAATSPATSTSATSAPACWPCSQCSCPSSATPAPSTPSPPSTTSPTPDHRNEREKKLHARHLHLRRRRYPRHRRTRPHARRAHRRPRTGHPRLRVRQRPAPLPLGPRDT
jgi:4-carboxymuconolactone decarboxylase